MNYAIFEHGGKFRRDARGEIELFAEEDRALELQGDGGDAIVSVTQPLLTRENYLLECVCYYDECSVLKMEITQPLQRALRTFEAALRADNQIESNG